MKVYTGGSGGWSEAFYASSFNARTFSKFSEGKHYLKWIIVIQIILIFNGN